MTEPGDPASVRVETIGAALLVTLDRPHTHNAIDLVAARAIAAAIARAGADASVRGVIITGAGDRTFMAGGDLNLIAELVKTGQSGEAIIDLGRELGACERAPVPVIAAVQGDVYGGGCEFLLLCDLVIMESHASLAFRHAKMGLAPAWGGLTRLVERVGPLEAARLLFTAEKIDAAEAHRLGLVNEVVPKGTAKARALALVSRIADNPRDSVAALKRALQDVREARRGDAEERERAVFRERWAGPDHLAAMNAYRSRK
ncbi:Enoyl-CoA hydratase [Minicystis rosea]|nr:Enoyl-CoA hydratase [Minicystis rosea]